MEAVSKAAESLQSGSLFISVTNPLKSPLFEVSYTHKTHSGDTSSCRHLLMLLLPLHRDQEVDKFVVAASWGEATVMVQVHSWQLACGSRLSFGHSSISHSRTAAKKTTRKVGCSSAGRTIVACGGSNV